MTLETELWEQLINFEKLKFLLVRPYMLMKRRGLRTGDEIVEE
jgi:hypothetical protein